jgi:hypothetical protein
MKMYKPRSNHKRAQTGMVSFLALMICLLALMSTMPNAHASATVVVTPPSVNTIGIGSITVSSFQPVDSSSWIWFNSNFKISGQMDGTTIKLTQQQYGPTIMFTQQQITIAGVGTWSVPDAIITFSATATYSTTHFDTGENAWITTVPLAGSDEIFLSGLTLTGVSVPKTTSATWTGVFTPQAGQPITLEWKFGAAVYKVFSADYNKLDVKAAHTNALSNDGVTILEKGLHAGTPVAFAYAGNCIKGARGGGASNFTGSWSGTQKLKDLWTEISPD